MRLLNVETGKLKEFFDTNIPSYAILSHTWNDGEVTFEDIENADLAVATSKPGYCKIRYACKQAATDNLGHVWVDTCCIDKRSSAELSEAINSMFRWYSESALCYAYLFDVFSTQTQLKKTPRDEDSNNEENPMPSEFAKSRYFTRGWTLQELLAPKKVIFFDNSWNILATKFSYSRGLVDITGIDQNVLRSGGSALERVLKTVSVARRMSWAASRETTRREDEAYSFVGYLRSQHAIVVWRRDARLC
jgi:hypothetical protein